MAALFGVTLAGIIALYLACATDPIERRRRRMRISIAVVATVLTIAALEVPAVVGWIDYRVVFQTDGLSTLNNPQYQLDRELIGIHLPHEQFRGLVAGDLVTRLQIPTDHRYAVDVRWDRHGFRNADEIQRADVVLIGDSFLEAALVPWEETVTNRLSRELDRPVLNLGHGGYGPQQELAVLRRFGFEAQPKVVVWFFYEGNDLSNYETYEAIQSQWDRWVEREHGFLRRSLIRNARIALKRLVAQEQSDPLRAASRMGILETPGEHYGQSMYFGYRCEPLTARDMEALVGTRKVFASAAKECEEHGAKLLVVFVPTTWRVYRKHVRVEPEAELATWRVSDLNESLVARGANLPFKFIDLTSALSSTAAEGELVYFPDDAHWTSSGHEVAAQVIANQVRPYLSSGE